MKQILLIAVGVVGVLGGLLYLLWLAGSQLFRDWRIGREVDQIQSVSVELRRKRKEQAAARLNNGCEHCFDEGYGEFPPNVCIRCGLERTKPPGQCDHIWQRREGNTPGSFCKTCGKPFRGSTQLGA